MKRISEYVYSGGEEMIGFFIYILMGIIGLGVLVIVSMIWKLYEYYKEKRKDNA